MPKSSPFEPLDADAGPAAESPLAPLDRRFLAAVADRFAGALTLAPAVAAVAATWEPDRADPPPLALAGVAVTLALLVALTGTQWYLLATRGQTIGKRMFDLRIVRQDGSAVDFVTAVVLRSWVTGFAIGLANNLCLGWVVFLADVLPVFGQDRKCLHDRIAGTMVVVD